MCRHPFALVVLVAIQAFASVAGAVCTAGNPNAAIIQATPTSAFTSNGDGTVTHLLTGLVWKQCVQGLSGATCATGTAASMTWSAALATAVLDATSGRNDWRLPNRKELESIAEPCGSAPAINKTLFPATPLTPAWSATTQVVVPNPGTRAFYVDFNDGTTFANSKAATYAVRLVRGGKSLAAFDANHLLQSAIDVDGNGTADPLTDGLLVIRYLFGLRGLPLIQGAVSPGATRSTSDIEAYLQSLLPR